jgi:hypothetical protein
MVLYPSLSLIKLASWMITLKSLYLDSSSILQPISNIVVNPNVLIQNLPLTSFDGMFKWQKQKQT